MKNLFKRAAAIFLVAVLAFSCAACHKPGELALTVGGEEFSSGFYACAFLAADNEAQQLVYEQASKQGITITSKNMHTQKIDGVVYGDWVKNKTLEICKQMIAAKQLCEKSVVKTAEYLDNAKQTAKAEWQSNKDYFEKNGIGLESYQKFCAYQEYATAYFDYLYGKGGPEEVKDDVLNKYITDNYVYLNALSIDITAMTEKQQQDQEKKYKDYIERIKKGESFGKIYAEAQGTKYTEDKTDEGTFSHSYAMLWGGENTGSYESPFFADVKDLKKGEMKIIVNDKAVDGYKYMFMVYMGNILSEKNTNLDTIKATAMDAMKGDEFLGKINEQAKGVTLTENTKSTKQFKVENVYYPESTSY